jgi:hypothetical protein
MDETRLEQETFKKYGIDILTGEADALSMRLLCELDAKMMQTYLSYTGFQFVSTKELRDAGYKEPLDFISHSQYNDSDKYSCFLTHEVMEDLIIMRLMEEQECVVEILPKKDHDYYGQKFLLSGGHEEIQDYLKDNFNSESSFYTVGRSYWIYKEQLHVGFSNVHAFTGMHQ